MTSADLLGWLLTYAAHSTLLLGLAWLASRRIQSHAIKDLLWKTALIGGLVTTTLQRSDVASLGGLGFRVAMPETAIAAPSTAAPAHQARLKPTTLAGQKTGATTEVAVVPSQPEAVEPQMSNPTANSNLPSTPSLPSPAVFLTAWAFIAAALVVRFIASRWRMAQGFGRRAPLAEGTLTMMLAELRVEAGIRRPVRLTHATGLSSPVAFGVSEICLPEAVLTDLDPDQQHSVLAHELAHLARFDPIWLDLAGILERVFFFQPLNVLARRRIQDGAEYLCDDWAVRRTGSGLTLAKCLVKVAEWMEGTPHAVPVSGMAEHRSQLVSRIHRLIGNHAMRTGPRPRWLLPASAVLLIATAAFAPGIAANRHVTTGPLPSMGSDDQPAMMASDTDTTVVSGSRRERVLSEMRMAADRDAVRLATSSARVSELRAELSSHARTLSQLDMARPVLAATLASQMHAELAMRDHKGDTNSVAVPALLEALKDPAVEVRRAAAQSLANLEDPRTVPGLVDALKDSDKEVRQSAAQGLGSLRDERAIDGLIVAMKDSDPEVRQAAIEALSELHSQKAVPGFTAALRDESKDVRRAAISALGSMENPRPVEALISALKDADPDVRHAAVDALNGSEDKRAVAPLIVLLADPVADVRQAAASALGSLSDPSAAQPIAALLKDSNADVRESAASALGSMELKSAPAGLLDALHDAKADVRQRAAETVGSIQDAKAVPGLKLLLDDANADVREAAVDALSNITDRSALDALIGALKSKDANVRKRAAEALGHRDE